VGRRWDLEIFLGVNLLKISFCIQKYVFFAVPELFWVKQIFLKILPHTGGQGWDLKHFLGSTFSKSHFLLKNPILLFFNHFE
jgi:hypothetical protein